MHRSYRQAFDDPERSVNDHENAQERRIVSQAPTRLGQTVSLVSDCCSLSGGALLGPSCSFKEPQLGSVAAL